MLARLLIAYSLLALTTLFALLALIALLAPRRVIGVVKPLRRGEGVNTAVGVLLLLAYDWLKVELGAAIHTVMLSCSLL